MTDACTAEAPGRGAVRRIAVWPAGRTRERPDPARDRAASSVDGGAGPRSALDRALRTPGRTPRDVEPSGAGGGLGLGLQFAHGGSRPVRARACSWQFLRSDECSVSVAVPGLTRPTTLRGRPRGRFRAITTPRSKISPPQTPQGSARSRAPARQASRRGHPPHRALATSSWAGALGEPQLRVLDPARQGAPHRGGCDRGARPPRGRAAGPGEPGSAVGRRVIDGLHHCRSSSYSSSATAGGEPPTGGRGRVPRTKRKAADPGVRVPRPRGGPVSG